MKRLFLLLLFLMVAGRAWATDVTFEDGVSSYTGTRDTVLAETAATTNYGTTTPIEISYWTSSDRKNYLVKFDLSSITGPVTVSSATLSLMQSSERSATTNVISAYRLLRDWSETQATWNIYSTGNNWSTAGAGYNNADRSSTVSATCSVGTSTWTFYDWTSAQLAADVQDMINNGSNYGWVLVHASDTNNYHGFVTREDGTATSRPKLAITYTVGSSSPTTKIILGD